jgi:hypothetical protein
MGVRAGAKTQPAGWQQRTCARNVKKSKVWLFALALGKVNEWCGGGHMVHINEELEAAKAAKTAIDFLLTATTKSSVLARLNKAKYAAVLNLSSGGGALNEARAHVGIALSNVIHGMPTQEKIDKAKRAIDAWIRGLEASKAA